MMSAVQEMSAYFAGHIEHRKKHPTDDLISTLMNARDKDGQPLSDMHVLGSLRLLLIAGIDTTWSAIGSSLWHLAKTPADRERLVAEPELMPTAVEELLRAYSPVTMAREVMKETDDQRLPGQARQHGAAVVPGRQPRPRHVPRRRQGGDRPQGKPPRRLRPRHSPLRRLQPRAHGDDGGDRGMAEAHSGFPARSGRQGHLVGRHRARTAAASDAVRKTGAADYNEQCRIARGGQT